MNLQEKIALIADYYGLNIQICKLGEEGAELGAVIAKKYVLIQSGELAQKYDYPAEYIERIMNAKAARQIERIKEGRKQ